MREVGQTILQRAAHAARRLAALPGVRVPFGGFFKEFVVDFTATGKTVASINQILRGHQIFGGKDLSDEFPELGQSALYCVTEIHAEADIERLTMAVAEAVR
jgi:glycine dehydrogenase subunit 1